MIPEPREGRQGVLGSRLDGVMGWVNDGWHAVKVGSCFEFGPGKEGHVAVCTLGYWAEHGDVGVVRQTMWGYAYHRGLGLEGKAVVIGDGAPWRDGFAEMDGPKRERIVDWYHAVEHLWALGREAFGEEASKWGAQANQQVWKGEVAQGIQACAEVLETKSAWNAGAARTAA